MVVNSGLTVLKIDKRKFSFLFIAVVSGIVAKEECKFPVVFANVTVVVVAVVVAMRKKNFLDLKRHSA